MAVRCHAWRQVFDLKAETGLSSVSAVAAENVQDRFKTQSEIVLILQGTEAALAGEELPSPRRPPRAGVCRRLNKRQLQVLEGFVPTPYPVHPAALVVAAEVGEPSRGFPLLASPAHGWSCGGRRSPRRGFDTSCWVFFLLPLQWRRKR